MLLLTPIAILIIAKRIETVIEYIIKQPEHQIAREHSVVTLQCRVKIFDKYEVHWVKDGFGLGNTRADIRQYGKPINNQHRYDLPFNLDEGEYDLRITNLTLYDEGIFYCQIVVDGRAHSSRKVAVQVLVPSQTPQLIQIINQGNGPKEHRNEKIPIIVNDGEYLFIKCIAKNGRPGPELHWFLNEIKINIQSNGDINGTLMGKVTVTRELSEKYGKLYNTQSLLKLKINSLKHGNWLKCLAESMGFENEKSKVVAAQIEVHTIPIVHIETYPKRSQDIFVEHDVVEFTCTATGRPNSFHWKWFINNIPVENIVDNKYKLRINRSHHKATIKCEAVSTRNGFKTMSILVKYGPEFKIRDSLMYPASIGDTVGMKCDVDGNPKPTVYWQRHSSDEIIERGTVLIKKDVQLEDFGIYKCTAKVLDFTPVAKLSYLAKKSKPVITHHPVTYGREGQTVKLSCTVESVPLPNDKEVKWIFGNRIIQETSRYKMYKEAFHGGVFVILQILFVQSSDFGDYNCTVKTSLGHDTATVIFQKQGETPILMIVVATIVFLSILLVTTIVLCICQRKKLKDDYMKGNPSSPEIPLHHEAKSTLIDSDCHCNPNLYSWIPQSFDVKSQNDVLNKLHYQENNFWPRSHEIESCYSNSVPDSQSSNKSMKINKHENVSTNPILYNMHTIGTNTLNRYSTSLPFSNFSMRRGERDPRFCDSSQCQQYIYQDLLNQTGDRTPQIIKTDHAASPIYVVKKPTNKTQVQFPADYIPSTKPIIKTKANDIKTNITLYTDQQNAKLVSDFASNI